MRFKELVTKEVFVAAVAKVCGQDVAEKFSKNCMRARFRPAKGRSFSSWFIFGETKEGWTYWNEQALKFEAAPQPEEDGFVGCGG